ncbi:MAG: hypothetical protein QM270_02285 [Bacillota bacterium]|nr:hypothetical protein [Bacillota bacterium]
MGRSVRENALALLGSKTVTGPPERLPILHFGYWTELLDKWAAQGHVTAAEAAGWSDGNAIDREIGRRLGFDQNYYQTTGAYTGLWPPFAEMIVEERSDGSYLKRNADGVIVMERHGAISIPTEVEHILVDRGSFESEYRPRLAAVPERLDVEAMLDFLRERQGAGELVGIHCGSYYGNIRNWAGLEGLAYIAADDPELYAEMIAVNAEMSFEVTRRALEAARMSGERFDFAHFWEDICFKNGPLVNPAVFRELVGPHYRRMTALLADYDIDIVSLDCDGSIDLLLPVWLENGVNTMFPIEVGTWHASIAPWRERYGDAVRGVGGTDKRVFAQDRAAVDAEIDRLLPLVEGGGYIPCPDHRLPLEAEWDLVRYYTDELRRRSARLFMGG